MSRFQTLHYRSGIESCVDLVTIPGFMSSEQCDILVESAELAGFMEASTIPQAETGVSKPGYRKTQEQYFDEEEFEWLYKGIAQTILNVNHNQFQFDITGLEPAVLLKYSTSQMSHYDWHRDMGGNYSAYRKLSMVVQMTDPEEYEGCNLEYFSEGINSPENTKKGTAYIFPAWLHHRVLPITSGVRYSLVCWSTGLKFR
jgi:PKHD-type hydroxylase